MTEVAKHILDRCICGPLLREKAVLLATHNLHTLERADQLLLLEGKRVAFRVKERVWGCAVMVIMVVTAMILPCVCCGAV